MEYTQYPAYGGQFGGRDGSDATFKALIGDCSSVLGAGERWQLAQPRCLRSDGDLVPQTSIAARNRYDEGNRVR